MTCDTFPGDRFDGEVAYIASSAEFTPRNVQTKNTKYVPLIRPEDKPAIWLNEQIMAKYRPEMKKYYYDPTKYKSYLDQLGIKYPTVRETSTTAQPRK